MSDDVKPTRRAYNAPSRRLQAQATRARILAAARQLLREHGYPATSLTMVARAAKVSVESVYDHFGTKRGLLSALVDAAVDPPQFDEHIQAAMQSAEPRQLLRMTAEFGRLAYDRSWDIVEAMRGAGVADPEIADAWRLADARARAGQAVVVQALVQRGVLRTDLSQTEAADVLWSLTAPDVYRMLVVESRWTSDRYAEWMADALARLLLRA